MTDESKIMNIEAWKEAIKLKRGFWFLGFLNRFRVEYLIIGGAAAAYHGLRRSGEDFADMDVMINPSKGNAARFADAMNAAASASGKVVGEKFDVNLMTKPAQRFSPDRNQFDIDFVTFLRPSEFAAAHSRANSPMISMMKIPVVALEDMLPRNKQFIALIQENISLIKNDISQIELAHSKLGKFLFPSTTAGEVSVAAAGFFRSVLRAGMVHKVFGRFIDVGGTVLRLVYVLPVEIYLPPDSKTIAALRVALMGVDGNASQIAPSDLVPGSTFLLNDRDRSLRIRIAENESDFLGNPDADSKLPFEGQMVSLAEFDGVKRILLKDLTEREAKLNRSSREVEEILKRV